MTCLISPKNHLAQLVKKEMSSKINAVYQVSSSNRVATILIKQQRQKKARYTDKLQACR